MYHVCFNIKHSVTVWGLANPQKVVKLITTLQMICKLELQASKKRSSVGGLMVGLRTGRGLRLLLALERRN